MNPSQQSTHGYAVSKPFYKRHRFLVLFLVLGLVLVACVAFYKIPISQHQKALNELIAPEQFDNQYSVVGFARTDYCTTTPGIFSTAADCYNYVDKMYLVSTDAQLQDVIEFINQNTEYLAQDSVINEYRHKIDGTNEEISLKDMAKDKKMLTELLAAKPNTDTFRWSFREINQSEYKSEYDGVYTNICIYRPDAVHTSTHKSTEYTSVATCGESSEGLKKAIMQNFQDKQGYLVSVSFQQYRQKTNFELFQELIR